MIDHERYRLLAAEAIAGHLSPDDARALQAHLATCFTCRAEAEGLELDHHRLIGALEGERASPRVRSVVLRSAQGRRQGPSWPILAAAALLIAGTVGAVVLVGGAPRPEPAVDRSAGVVRPTSPTPGPSTSSVDRPTATASSPMPAAATPSPPASVAAPTPSSSSTAATGGSVSGAYTYVKTTGEKRVNSVAVRGTDPLEGTWSRENPVNHRSFGGPVTCLVIDGADAWMAGPVTIASDGSKGLAAMLYVHDGGSKGDRAETWISDPGQTLKTMETWCRNRFIPDGPFRVESGDIVIEAP